MDDFTWLVVLFLGLCAAFGLGFAAAWALRKPTLTQCARMMAKKKAKSNSRRSWSVGGGCQ